MDCAPPRKQMGVKSMKYFKRTGSKNEEFWGYLFILPQFFGIVVFMGFPVIQSLFISFHKWDFMSEAIWVGLDNYKTILTAPYTYKILGNTLYYMLGTIPLTTIIAIVLAFLLAQPLKGTSIYRSLFFLPNITSSVAISLVWLWLFNPDMGIVNLALDFFGIEPFGWYTTVEGAMPTVILLAVWRDVGYYVVLFLAGIKGISGSYYEAARIDGASQVSCFFKITLPLLTPTIFFAVTMMLINGFQVFNETYMLTRGGPADATKTIVLEIYNNAFQYFKMGSAAVYSWILFVVILIATLVQFITSKKWVNYDV